MSAEDPGSLARLSLHCTKVWDAFTQLDFPLSFTPRETCLVVGPPSEPFWFSLLFFSHGDFSKEIPGMSSPALASAYQRTRTNTALGV